MAKKVLILKGSPRENGNSATLANQVFEGAKEAGAEVESVYLHGLDIRPCDGCYMCENGMPCVIDDDMQALYPKLRQADGILLASPIYWFFYSAQLKLCIDRWIAFETGKGSELRGKKIGIVLTYGDSNPDSSGAVNAIHAFESMFSYIGADMVGMVYGTGNKAGEIAQQKALMEKAYKLGQMLAA